MIIVTILTGLLVAFTLRAQLRANNNQKELLEIELIKLKEQFHTEIQLSGGNTWTNINTIWINLTAINHDAHNVHIKNEADSDFKHEFLTNQFKILRVGNWQGVIEKQVSHEELAGKYHILVFFEDATGNKYRQTITGSFTDPVISTPTLIPKNLA
ncbi:MAG: hypothetical protein ACTHNW_20555 [Mucilaginibacter sp.]